MRQMKFVLACGATMLAVTGYATESSVPFIRADLVHQQGNFGLGVTVAVIDSGVCYEENGLGGGIAQGGISFINGVPIGDYGQDPGGSAHGTLASLIITDPSGVAPRAKILPIRVMAPGTGVDPRDVARALDCASQHCAGHPTRQEGSQESANYGCLPHSTRAGTGIRSWLRLHGLRGTQPAAVASE